MLYSACHAHATVRFYHPFRRLLFFVLLILAAAGLFIHLRQLIPSYALRLDVPINLKPGDFCLVHRVHANVL